MKYCKGKRKAVRPAVILLTMILAFGLTGGAVFAAVPVSGKETENAALTSSLRTSGGAGNISAAKRKSGRLASQKMKVRVSSRKISVGKTAAIKVKGVKGGAKITYKSSNPSAASVSSSGTVTAKKVGTTVITVSAAQTSKYKAAKRKVKIYVLPGATSSLMAENKTNGIRVTWAKVAGASGYILYRNGRKIASIDSGSTVTWLDKKAAKKAKKYTYKLVAKGSTGKSRLSRSVTIYRGTGAKQATSESSASSGSSSDSGGSSSGTESGNTSVTPDFSTSMSIRYCLEKKYVKATLEACKKGDMAVIDLDGISAGTVSAATKRGVTVYGYLNAGSLESDRSYFSKYKSILLAEYDGWDGEYWVDVTASAWLDHLIEEAKKIKSAGASGIYFDNADIYYMVEEGFRTEGTKLLRTAPTLENVYKSLSTAVKKISATGLSVMPNGGETFVQRFEQENPGVIREVNQESVLFTDNRAQSAGDTKYLTRYLDWCRTRGMTVRGIEYINTQAGAQKAAAYYKEHGWKSLYISKHAELYGD